MKIKKYNEFITNDTYINIDVKNLIETIEKKRGNCSVLPKVWSLPEYKKIIENGTDSIPFLLEKLNDNTAMFWLQALTEITSEEVDKDALKSGDRINAWKTWGIKNGY